MKNRTLQNRVFSAMSSTLIGLVFGMGATLDNVVSAQSTNWFINFDVPGAATANGWTNYFGPGAYTNATEQVIVTNSNDSLTTNVINAPYYWNAIADNSTNSNSVLGDGVTPSLIVFANTDL